ncbi:FRG1-like family protein [Ostertagia ostertagi]
MTQIPERYSPLIKTPDDPKTSFKTGYGKYIGVDSNGALVATAEAIGQRERFQVVLKSVLISNGGKSAIQAVCNPLFLSMAVNKDGMIYVASKKAGDEEMVNIRTNAKKTGPVDWRADEDKKSAKDCSTAYVYVFLFSVGLQELCPPDMKIARAIGDWPVCKAASRPRAQLPLNVDNG